MKLSKKSVLLIGAIGLVAVFIYGYGRYGLEFGKFFAAGPGSPGSVIRCFPTQQSAGSGSPVTFTATVTTPSPTPPAGCYYQQVQCVRAPCPPQLVCPSPPSAPVGLSGRTGQGRAVVTPTPTPPTPTPVVPSKITWTATGGSPASGTGGRFTTAFVNKTRAAVVQKVVAQYDRYQAICYVTVAPMPTPTVPPPTTTPPPPTPISPTPAALPNLSSMPDPSPGSVLSNGPRVLLNVSFSRVGVPDIGWKKMRFDLSKTSAVALSNFRLRENNVDITTLGSFLTNCTGSGCNAGSATFTVNPGHRVVSSSNRTYSLWADVSGVSGPGYFVTTSILRPWGTGQYISGTYAQMAAGIATLVWTDSPSLGESSSRWFTDRNIQFLPFSKTLNSPNATPTPF